MGTVIRQVTISGRVQGVGYRAWVENRARAHGLEGWVRNRRDGSVEALLVGPPEVVADLVARCRRGPSTARVDGVTDEPADADSLKLRRPGERFSMLPTV
jgi:acylphosphatase